MKKATKNRKIHKGNSSGPKRGESGERRGALENIPELSDRKEKSGGEKNTGTVNGRRLRLQKKRGTPGRGGGKGGGECVSPIDNRKRNKTTEE